MTSNHGKTTWKNNCLDNAVSPEQRKAYAESVKNRKEPEWVRNCRERAESRKQTKENMNKTKLPWMNEKERKEFNTRILEHVESEAEVVDAYEMYDEALDSNGDIHIGSLSYAPSNVLKKVDSIAYNCGFNDFMDSMSDTIIEIGSSYYNRDDVKEALEALSYYVATEFATNHKGYLDEDWQEQLDELVDYVQEYEF